MFTKFEKHDIVQLLEFLERKYPGTYASVEAIKKEAPIQVNPNILLRNLIFCFEEHFIEASPIKTEEGIVDFANIKITSTGIRYLRNI